MLSLDIGRVAEISTITWEPTTDDDHLVLVDHIGTAASMWVRSGAVIRGERLYPCERRYGKDVGIVISEGTIETVSAIEVATRRSVRV